MRYDYSTTTTVATAKCIRNDICVCVWFFFAHLTLITRRIYMRRFRSYISCLILFSFLIFFFFSPDDSIFSIDNTLARANVKRWWRKRLSTTNTSRNKIQLYSFKQPKVKRSKGGRGKQLVYVIWLFQSSQFNFILLSSSSSSVVTVCLFYRVCLNFAVYCCYAAIYF